MALVPGSLIEQRSEPVDALSGARRWGYGDGQCTVMPSWGLQMRLMQGQNAKIPFLSIIRATPVARGRVMREHCPSVTREPSEVEIQRHEGGCLLQL